MKRPAPIIREPAIPSTFAYTVLIPAAGHLPPSYAAGAAFLVPLIGFAAVAWAFVPDRNRRP
jgi:hypothetical protein